MGIRSSVGILYLPYRHESAVLPPFLEGFPLQMFKNASHAPGFVDVSCYKSSGSILSFFELILKAYTWGVPNRSAIVQDRAHQSSVCCLFYLMWTRVYISSREAKGPISLSANVADICIPSQITGDSDPKILDTFDVFEDRSLQSMHICSMDLFDPFPCRKRGLSPPPMAMMTMAGVCELLLSACYI